MRKIKAVFLDVDGTIISIKNHTIPQSAIDAINRIRKKGVLVFLCTSRAKQFMSSISSIQFDGYVCLTGAHCVDSMGNFIDCYPIAPTDVVNVIRWSQQNDRPLFGISAERLYAWKPHDSVVNEVLSLGGLRIDKIGNYFIFPDFLSSSNPELLAKEISILQFTSYFSLQEEISFMKMMPNCHTERWYPTFSDIVSNGVSKAYGIDVMASHFGFAIDETMAVGDGGNDVSMICHAAIGVAMGNASDEVKKVADYVTDDVDSDGLKKALDRYV